MLNPFQTHAALAKAAQAMLGGQSWNGDRTRGATIQFAAGVLVPCTTSPLVRDFELAFGKSRTDFVEQCEFLASDAPAGVTLDKGMPVTLVMGTGVPGKAMQLWHGGLLPGGQLYRFMLVDAVWKG
jgi:hypothetical protein